jgi:hypothetical protein
MGHALGRLVAACPSFPEGDLVPVPLHRGSPRSFNQAKLLAEGMASVLSRPVRDVLEWQRSLPPQAERSAATAEIFPKRPSRASLFRFLESVILAMTYAPREPLFCEPPERCCALAAKCLLLFPEPFPGRGSAWFT